MTCSKSYGGGAGFQRLDRDNAQPISELCLTPLGLGTACRVSIWCDDVRLSGKIFHTKVVKQVLANKQGKRGQIIKL